MKARFFYFLLTAMLALTAVGSSVAAMRMQEEIYFYIPAAVLTSLGAALLVIFLTRRWDHLVLPKNADLTITNLAFAGVLWAFPKVM